MKKSLLTIESLSDETLASLIDLSVAIKANPNNYRESIKYKNLGMIFEKPSTRTRVSFEVGISQLGGSSFDLSPKQIQPGKRESIKDIPRTLSRYLDGLILRTFSHDTILEMNEFCSIPVINGLSDYAHPCQALADYLTILEKFGDRKDLKVVYCGDGNNVLNSLMILLSRIGLNLVASTPEAYGPDKTVFDKAVENCKKSGGSMTFCSDPNEAVKDADVIYTDVWVSMGEEESGKSSDPFKPYQLNMDLIKKAKDSAIVLHCLPAHIGEEITEDVFESEHSVVFDQAENRLHAQKAVLKHLLS